MHFIGIEEVVMCIKCRFIAAGTTGANSTVTAGSASGLVEEPMPTPPVQPGNLLSSASLSAAGNSFCFAVHLDCSCAICLHWLKADALLQAEN